jgi:hypothetical protein
MTASDTGVDDNKNRQKEEVSGNKKRLDREEIPGKKKTEPCRYKSKEKIPERGCGWL